MDPTPNLPASQPDVTALIAKHQAEINRIMALDSQSQQAEVMRYGLTPEAFAARTQELQVKAKELQKKAASAGRTSAIMGWVAAIGTAIVTYFKPKDYFSAKWKKGLFMAATSLGVGTVAGWIGSKMFGGKVREESAAFTQQARGIFERELAIAIENTTNGQAKTGGAAGQDAQNIRTTLLKPIGQNAVELGIISDAQRNRILEIKTRFLALANSGQRLETGHGWDLLDDAKWQQTASAKGIGEAQMVAARQTIDENKGTTKEQTPAFGEIGMALGYFNQDTLSAILAAQAAERTLQATGLSEKGDVAALAALPKWQRIGNPKDPAYLQSAQASNFLAAILSAAVNQMDGNVSPDVRAKIENAMSAVQTLSVASYAQAATALSQTQATAALGGRIGGVALDIASKTGKSAEPDSAQIQRAVDILGVGLDAAKGYLVGQNKISAGAWPAAQIQEKMNLARSGLAFAGPGVTPPMNPGKTSPGNGIGGR